MTPKAGDILTLKGKTRKGKNRIEKWGNKWRVYATSGYDIMIVSIKDFSNHLPDSARWFDNKDFEIVSSKD